MHETTTDAFLIARDETTYGEWLAFLGGLPADEQARRSGRPEGTVFQSALTLTLALTDTWQLELRRGAQVQRARFGEKIRQPRRAHGIEQDWTRWPVTGITWEDALAYLEWLDRTGKVPGARFCSELEWERAARGADGRNFPTGDDISPSEANFDESYGRDPEAMGPDQVGTHADIVSPFGLHDTVGNVWEWVQALGDATVACGGSFYHGKVAARAVNRTRVDASFADVTLGLRVCAAAPHVSGPVATHAAAVNP